MNQPISPTDVPSTSPTHHRQSNPRRGLGWINRLLAVCLLWLSAAPPTWATPLVPANPASQSATITVTNTNDTGPGSLRQALADASPGDTIVIGVTGTIFLLSGELVISKNLTIQGKGSKQSALSAEFLSRVLSIASGATVQISGVSIREGVATSDGGGINNAGTLTLIDSIVSENAVSNSSGNTGGDGIHNTGNLTLIDVVVENNSGNGIDNRGTLELSNSTVARHPGFGIANVNGARLKLTDSKIIHNASVGINNSGSADVSMSSIGKNANGGITNSGHFTLNSSTVYSNTKPSGHGGGIYSTGTFTTTNSTISGNTVPSFGGGIYGERNLYVSSTTVSQNYAYQGGGLFSASATVYLRNSIVAGNYGSSNNSPDTYGTIQSQGYNLIGNTDRTTILGTTIGNQTGNANLAPLNDNGGPSLTHALLSDSPAIDGGKPTGCRDGDNVFLTTDQRGAMRTVDGNSDGEAICDIGAYEYASEFEVTPTPTPDPVSSPTLTAVTPTEGASSGGTSITLQGGNFQSGMSVSLDGAACANVVVNNSSNASCTTPSHFPAVVDVAVTNPGGQRATLLRGFTYRGSTAGLGLPDVIADSDSTVEVPVQATAIDGLMAISLTVGYDGSKASLGNVTTGSLTGGWSVISNTVSSGRVQISMANPGAPAQGNGTLALLHFQVTGSPGQTSPLSIVGVSLNDGTIPTTTTAGSLVVDTLSTLAGQVSYWTESRPVPSVAMNLTGANSRSATTDSSGLYSLADVPSGSYTLAPSKSDGVGTDAITSFDASLVLRHSAGAALLSGNAAMAADVDRNGSITPMDASYILRKSVRLIDVPFPGAGRVWDFTPPSRVYAPLSGDQAGQNFTALLLGDVSGNWGSGQGQAQTRTEAVRLTLSVGDRKSLDRYLLALTPGATPVYSLDLRLRYPEESGATPVVALGSLAGSFALGSHSPTPGTLFVGLAGAVPLQSSGELLTIRWVDSSGNPVAGPSVEVVEARINEGDTPVLIETGVWGKLFLPTVGR